MDTDATARITDLMAEGVDGIRLYTMNDSCLAHKIYNNTEDIPAAWRVGGYPLCCYRRSKYLIYYFRIFFIRKKFFNIMACYY